MTSLSAPSLSPYRIRLMTQDLIERDHWTEGWDPAKPETYNDKVAVLNAVEPAVLAKLISILQPNVHGQAVRSPEQLDSILENASEPQSLATVPHDHLRVFYLWELNCSKSVYWPRLAQYFDEASPTHRQQIRDFFEHVLIMNLDKLLAVGSLPFKLPDDLRHDFPIQQMGGANFIRSGESGSWVREDLFHAAYEVNLTRQEWCEESGKGITTNHSVAFTGTLKEALAISSLYLSSLQTYYKSAMDMRNAQPSINTPVAIRILDDQRNLIVEGIISEQFVNADDNAPNASHCWMLRYENTWQRRPDAEEVKKLERLIDEYQASRNQAYQNGDPALRFTQLIEAAVKRRALYDAAVPNDELEKMIFAVDQRLGNVNHLDKYFSEDLGL